MNADYIIKKIEENSWKSDPLAVEVSLEGKVGITMYNYLLYCNVAIIFVDRVL